MLPDRTLPHAERIAHRSNASVTNLNTVRIYLAEES